MAHRELTKEEQRQDTAQFIGLLYDKAPAQVQKKIQGLLNPTFQSFMRKLEDRTTAGVE